MMMDTRIYAHQIQAMIDKLQEGMLIKTPLGKSKLLHKYKYFAQTDKGNWKWIEVYLAENGAICEDRKKLINRKMEEIKAYYEDRTNSG